MVAHYAATGFFITYKEKRMASFTIEIADNQVERVITALCANYNYNSQISNPDYDPALEVEEDYDPSTNPQTIDNPETPYQFANRITREYLQNNTTAYEVQQAKIAAKASQADPPAITDPAL